MGPDNSIFDLSSLSSELRLLLTCMKTNEGKIEIESEINWEHFLELVFHHRVYPLVYRKLKNLKEGAVPVHVIEALANDYRKNTFQMLYLSGEMERLFKLFNEHGIQALMLKGPVLAADLYGELSLRTSKDLDILLPKGYLKSAEELLLDLGYKKDSEYEHHNSYVHSKNGINVEIHWRLHPGLGREPSFKELWERRSVSSLTSYPVFYLGREDLFLFLVSHGARHGWFRLRWLGDIDQLVRREKNWADLIDHVRNYHYEYITGQAILLVKQLFHTPVSPQAHELIRENKALRLARLALFYIREMRHRDSYLPWNEFVYNKFYLFSLRPDSGYKWSFILGHLYPNTRDRATLPLPNYLSSLYVPLKPWLWLWRRVRKI